MNRILNKNFKLMHNTNKNRKIEGNRNEADEQKHLFKS